MHGSFKISALLAIGLVMPIGGALAGEGGACGSFELYSSGEDRRVGFVDQSPEGESVGDQRIGYRTLLDKDGNAFGSMRWVETMLDKGPGDEGPNTALIRHFFQLPAGLVVVEHTYEAKSTFPNTDKIAATSGELAVVGGTGAYRNARGIMRKLRGEPGDLRTDYHFELVCD